MLPSGINTARVPAGNTVHGSGIALVYESPLEVT
jgi:hypothetical protein